MSVNKKLAVEIAKDVLKRLRKKKLFLVRGAYISRMYNKVLVLKSEDQAQEHIDGIESTCYVCGLGGMLLSYIRLKNKCMIKDIGCMGGTCGDEVTLNVIFDTVENQLNKAFSKNMLLLIECAFEQKYVYQTHESRDLFIDKYKNQEEKAIEFGMTYVNSNKRLAAIMRNVVKNEGVFKP